jgi:hypothetical protein
VVEIERISLSRLDQYAFLLRSVFQKKFLTPEYLQWQYIDNPCGSAVGFDAISEGMVVAHYACIPIQIGMKSQPFLLSLNTATTPRFQGQGLFKRLALSTYEDSSKRFQGVIGVANQNSFPGFIRSLGFHHLGNLDLRLGQLSRPETELDEVRYSSEYLSWRTSSPRGGFSTLKLDHGSIVKRKVSRFLPKLETYVPGDDLHKGVDDLREVQGRVALTLDWTSSKVWKRGILLPERLKPSPLHLIYRDLAHRSQTSDSPLTRFTFLDFDAF